MKKVILILFLLLAPVGIAIPVIAQTPAQFIQWTAVVTPNPGDSTEKLAGQISVQGQQKLTEIEQTIQEQRKKYTSQYEKLKANLTGFANKILSALGLDDALNKSQTADEASGSDKKDGVIARVESNADSAFNDEGVSGVEGDAQFLAIRNKKRQENNMDKMARLLVLKAKLPKIAEEVEKIQGELKQAVDKVNSNDKEKSSVEEALRLNTKIKLVWYQLLSVQMQIETYNLDALAAHNLTGMPRVTWDKKFKPEYQIKAPEKPN